MSEVVVTESEFAAGITLPTGQRHVIRLLPDAVRLGLFGTYFDTDKNFILPRGLGNLKHVKPIYEKFPNAKLLIVGHTDTAGTPEYNDELSLERAEAMAAYLTDDVDAWLARYKNEVKESKRWGQREDLAMLRYLRARDFAAQASSKGTKKPDAATKDGSSRGGGGSAALAKTPEQMIRAFQRANGLSEDGIAGPLTRRELITQYMAEDDTTLPDTIEVTNHGCGEHFPLNASGTELDAAPADDVADAVDRRVELFFFNLKVGIHPPPPGKNSKAGSTEYPAWRKVAKPVGDWGLSPLGITAARSNTRFTQESSFPKPSLLPTLKKVASLLAGDALLNVEIVGHTDAQGDRDKNIRLSKSRAETVAAWLSHDAAAFRARFDSDDPFRRWSWEEVQWMLLAVSPGGSPAYISQVDGSAGPETFHALCLFQALSGLEVSGLADDTTLAALIEAYLALSGTPIGPERLLTSGAGPDHPLVSFGANQSQLTGDGSVQQLRRVDFFITEGRMAPRAGGMVEIEDTYEKWCAQVVVDASLPNVFDTRVAVVDGQTLPRVGVRIVVVESADTGEDSATVSGSVAEATTDAEGSFTVQLPRGFYGIEAEVGSEILRAALAIDPDVYGAARVALVPTPKFEPVESDTP